MRDGKQSSGPRELDAGGRSKEATRVSLVLTEQRSLVWVMGLCAWGSHVALWAHTLTHMGGCTYSW